MSRNLKFQPVEPLTVVNREYGLMRVFNDRSMTPFPRASKGVDAETLRKRLTEQHKHGATSVMNILAEEQQEMQMQRNTKSPPAVHIAISRFRYTPEHLLRGTPHPAKGKAVDPKLLIKNLVNEQQSIHFEPSTLRKSIQSARSSTNTKYVSVGTPHPLKRIVLNPKKLVRRLTAVKLEEFAQSKKKKKVEFLSPQRSLISYVASDRESVSYHSASYDSLGPKPPQTFEERRRLFHMNEFKIAKNGKKLSIWPLSEGPNLEEIRNSLQTETDNANEEIESFMRKQGMAKAARNIVTNVRTARRSHKRVSNESTNSRLFNLKESSRTSMESVTIAATAKLPKKRETVPRVQKLSIQNISGSYHHM